MNIYPGTTEAIGVAATCLDDEECLRGVIPGLSGGVEDGLDPTLGQGDDVPDWIDHPVGVLGDRRPKRGVRGDKCSDPSRREHLCGRDGQPVRSWICRWVGRRPGTVSSHCPPTPLLGRAGDDRQSQNPVDLERDMGSPIPFLCEELLGAINGVDDPAGPS